MCHFISVTFSFLDRLANRSVGENYNPFSRLGTLAITCIAIAVVTGVGLLPFYRVSIIDAYDSVRLLMEVHPRTFGLIHSMHRYSADLAVVFSILHLLRIIGNRAFIGARAWSWILGWVSFFVLWVIGWTGAWLIWDASGYTVARFIARLADTLSIFGFHLEPAFTHANPVNDKIFFVVFFLHMLIPLAFFVSLWLHVSRVNRPRFLADRRNALFLIAFVLSLALVAPAAMDVRANPFHFPKTISPDWFYLGPFVWFQEYSPIFTLSIGLLCFLLVLIVPWFFRSQKVQPSFVTESACIGCGNCATDCPYSAIEMRPRTDGKNFETAAWVDPNRCIGCGICNGSCDSSANNLPWLTTKTVHSTIDKFALGSQAKELKVLAFCCREAISVESQQQQYAIISVPCGGEVNPSSVKRAFDVGFESVLIATCDPGSCCFREGDRWIRERLDKKRSPVGKLSIEERSKAEAISFRKGDWRSFEKEFKGRTIDTTKHFVPRRIAGGIFIAVGLLVASIFSFSWLSRISWALPKNSQPILMISFRDAPKALNNCHKVSSEEKAKMLPHMRRDEICERARPASHIQIEIDGSEKVNRIIHPMGLRSDGFSVATVSLPIEPGKRDVHIQILEEGKTEQDPQRKFSQSMEFEADHRYLIEFQKTEGFKVFP